MLLLEAQKTPESLAVVTVQITQVSGVGMQFSIAGTWAKFQFQ